MKKIIIGALVVYFSMCTAQAGIIAKYQVGNYNFGNAAHGLYTFGAYNPQAFTIDALFTVFDNNGHITATLDGSLANANHSGTINLDFDDWRDNFNYKVEGGANNGGINADFFVDISGTININNTQFSISNCDQCGYAFQYGLGANAKNPNELGASAWIQHAGHTGTQHWDLNVGFSAVPEPGILMLISLGLIGLVLNKRKQQLQHFSGSQYLA